MAQTPDVALPFLAGLLLGALLALLAVLAWRSWRGPGDGRYLALYLGLVAANYALDATAKLLNLAALPAAPLWWGRLLPVLADPPVLLLFGLSLLGPPRRAWLLLALAPVLPALFLAFPPPSAGIGAWDLRLLHVGLMVACYAGAFAAAVLAHARETAPLRRERASLLVVLLGLVVLPRLPLAYVDAGMLTAGRLGDPATMAPVLALLPLVFLLAVLLALRAHRDRAEALRPLALLGGLCACLAGLWLLSIVPPLRKVMVAWVYASRWFLFLGVLVQAAPALDLLALAPPVARRARLAFALALGVAAAGSVGGMLAATGVGAVPALLVGMGLVALAVAAWWSLRRALPEHAREPAWRREAILRAHLEAGSPPERVEEVRRRLCITPEEAARVAELSRLAREAPAAAFPAQGLVFLGRHEPLRILAWGRAGAVHLAWDRVGGRHVVLKEVRSPDGRWMEEARKLLTVSHPNVVRVEGVEPVEGGAVLVLEHVAGPTLRDRLAKGPLEPEEARRVVADVLRGLQALHAEGLVHRDVKPENVALRPDGGAVLLDLGAACQTYVTPTLPALGHPGTLGYASPEQRQGERLDGRSDLYAVGVLAWECLTGRRPPEGDPPAAWRPVLERALAPDPAARWRDADAFRAALPRGGLRRAPAAGPGARTRP